MIQNPRRSELSRVPFLNNALDLILSGISQVFGVEHDEEGHHTDVTATSVTASSVVVDDVVELGTLDTNVTGIALGTQWQIVEAPGRTPSSSSDQELEIIDTVNEGVNGSGAAVRLIWIDGGFGGNDRWVLTQGHAQGSELHIGRSGTPIAELYVDTSVVSSSFTASLIADLAGQVRLTGVISPAQLTGDVNDYNPTGLSTAAVLRLSSDASRTITGLQAQTDGTWLTLINGGAQDIVLANQSGLSAAANVFVCPGLVAYTLNAGDSVQVWYDGTSDLWRVIAT